MDLSSFEYHTLLVVLTPMLFLIFPNEQNHHSQHEATLEMSFPALRIHDYTLYKMREPFHCLKYRTSVDKLVSLIVIPS